MFQSTRPRRGAISALRSAGRRMCCFNPRAPGGARSQSKSASSEAEEFQSTRPRSIQGIIHFAVSIHAPPEGRDTTRRSPVPTISKFQSTRPRRGAIPRCASASMWSLCFNPRAPGGARSVCTDDQMLIDGVSIHAPPEGRD